jgi:hypothetical protein
MSARLSFTRAQGPLLLVATVGLAVLVATYLVYFEAARAHRPAGYIPLGLGAASFFAVVFAASYLVPITSASMVRSVTALGVAAVATLVFVVAFAYLLLNTLGS